jgi:hypothetical protein
LEVLLLLHSQPQRSWTAQAVYEVILSSLSSIEERLAAFARGGLAELLPGIPMSFRYAAPSELAGKIDDLASLYRIKPVRVIEAIFKKRPNPVQSFADAFKFTKPPPP